MKKLFSMSMLVLLIVSLTSVISYAEGNLVANPSFEEAGGPIPASWATWTYDPNPETTEFKVEEGQGHTGTKFISITNKSENDARLKQTISVKENATYKLSCWAKTENVGEQKTGAIISLESYIDSSKDIKGTDGNWQYLEMYAKIGSGITSINVTVGLGGYGNVNTGKAYFDDISVEEVLEVPNGVQVAQIAPQQPQSQPDNPQSQSTNSGSNNLLLIVIIGAIAVIAGVTYFIFATKRTGGSASDSTEENSDYEDEDGYEEDEIDDDELGENEEVEREDSDDEQDKDV